MEADEFSPRKAAARVDGLRAPAHRNTCNVAFAPSLGVWADLNNKIAPSKL